MSKYFLYSYYTQILLCFKRCVFQVKKNEMAESKYQYSWIYNTSVSAVITRGRNPSFPLLAAFSQPSFMCSWSCDPDNVEHVGMTWKWMLWVTEVGLVWEPSYGCLSPEEFLPLPKAIFQRLVKQHVHHCREKKTHEEHLLLFICGMCYSMPI